MNILFCHDATANTEKAATLLCRFELPHETKITLFGIRSSTQTGTQLQNRIQSLSNLFADYSLTSKVVTSDSPLEPITVEAAATAYDLVVIADIAFHRGFSLFKHDSTAIKLAGRIENPLLIVRADPTKIRRILFCSSAEEAARRTFQRSIPLIKMVQADITIMHVMSQVTLQVPTNDHDLLDTAESHIARNTREGQHLAWALDFLTRSGLSGTITPRLRNGLVLDQVNAEVNENQIDLLVIGSHHRPGQTWLMEFMLEDVARDLLREVPCSVLIL